jgi:choline dehydrogenase-like flavoprotein
MADIEADVIIVGSGIAGALLAARLSNAGIKVALLEAGATVDRVEATQRFWDAVIRVPECPYPPSPQADHPISNDPDYWYRQIGPDKFKSTYLKVVGGTTWHWLGTCLRLVPSDFRLRTAYGCGVDWPVTYEELEPFYGQAENEIGVAGDSSETLGSPRSSAYPMPVLHGQGVCAGARRDRAGRSRDAAGPQFNQSRRAAGVLRECQLHPGVSRAGEI